MLWGHAFSMYITHILPERKCCESYQGSNRLAIGHKPLPLRHSRNWRLHLMTSQLICLKIDVKGQRRDVKVHNRDKLFCQFVHSLLMKICLNHEGTRIQQNVVTKGLDPCRKKLWWFCWFVNSVNSRRWLEDGLTLTVQMIRMRPNLFSIFLCVKCCVSHPPWSSGASQHIFSRDWGDGAKVMLLVVVHVHFPWRAGSGSLGDYRLHRRQTTP